MKRFFKSKKPLLVGISIFLLGVVFAVSYLQKPLVNIGEMPMLYDGKYYSLEGKIQEQTFLFKIDTGIENQVSLRKEVLTKILDKKYITTRKSHDINGNSYEENEYKIDKISFDKFFISNAPVREEDSFFVHHGSRLTDKKQNPTRIKSKNAQTKIDQNHPPGRIGTTVFRAFHYWLFDFSKPSLSLIKSLDQALQDKVICLDDFIQADLDPSKSHFIIEVETDFRKKRFALDTGAQDSIIHQEDPTSKHLYQIHLKKLIIDNHNFEGIEIFISQAFFTEEFDDFDGILGMNFLKDRRMLLDLKNNKVYISR